LGNFSLQNLPFAAAAQIRAANNLNPLNGVTTYDIALLSQHILGSQVLESPYRIIAADINHDGDVTGADMTQLRRLILHLVPTFPSNTSWRFVDKSYVFRFPDNPFGEDFREVVNFSSLQSNNTANFVAIKVGDLNGSVVTDRRPLRRTKVKTLTLETAEQALKTGDITTIDIKATNFNVFGFQMTLQTAGLEILDIQSADLADLTTQNFGLFDQALTVSWNNKNVILEKSGTIFRLQVKVKRNALLSELLQVTSALTPAEAYERGTGEEMNIALRFGSADRSSKMELYQNIPNPSKESTKIGFYVSQAQEVTFHLTDGLGKVWETRSIAATEGYNAIELDLNNLPSGVWTYSIQTATQQAVRKMLIVR
jgi:hypothetical protein